MTLGMCTGERSRKVKRADLATLVLSRPQNLQGAENLIIITINTDIDRLIFTLDDLRNSAEFMFYSLFFSEELSHSVGGTTTHPDLWPLMSEIQTSKFVQFKTPRLGPVWSAPAQTAGETPAWQHRDRRSNQSRWKTGQRSKCHRGGDKSRLLLCDWWDSRMCVCDGCE